MAKPEGSSTSSHSSGGGNGSNANNIGGGGGGAVGIGVSGISGSIVKHSTTIKNSNGNSSDVLDTTRAHNRKEKERMRKQLRENAHRLQLLEQQMQSLSSEVAYTKSTTPSPKHQMQPKKHLTDQNHNDDHMQQICLQPVQHEQLRNFAKEPPITNAAIAKTATTRVTVTTNHLVTNSSTSKSQQHQYSPPQSEVRATTETSNPIVKKQNFGDPIHNLKQYNVYRPHLELQSLSQHQVQHTSQRLMVRNATLISQPSANLEQYSVHPNPHPILVHGLREISPTQPNVVTSPDSLDGFGEPTDSFHPNVLNINDNTSSSNGNNSFALNELASSNPSQFSIESLGSSLQTPPQSLCNQQLHQPQSQPQTRLQQQHNNHHHRQHHHAFSPLLISNLDSMNVSSVPNSQAPIAPNSARRPSWFGVPF